MFNFSANHIKVLTVQNYSKCNLYTVQDVYTKRIYKLYDYSKSHNLESEKVYCISGKINSADKIYLILEQSKEDKKYYENLLNFQGSNN